MISISNLTKIYYSKGKPITALDNVSFKIGRQEFVSLVGKSGAGKTTLLKLILAEETPTSGAIFFEGQNIFELKKTSFLYLGGGLEPFFKIISCFLLKQPMKMSLM